MRVIVTILNWNAETRPHGTGAAAGAVDQAADRLLCGRVGYGIWAGSCDRSGVGAVRRQASHQIPLLEAGCKAPVLDRRCRA